MGTLKIIQINSASSSFAVKDYENDVYRNWCAQVAFQIKKFYPKLEIECWTPEKQYKKEKETVKDNIRFRIFPTSFSIRHSMEISFPMLNALKEEIKKNKKLIIHFHEYHSWQVYLLLMFIKKNNNVKIISQHHGGRNPFGNLKKYVRLILFLPIILCTQFLESSLFKKVDIFYALSDEEINYLKKITPNSKIKFQTMGVGKDYFRLISKTNARKKLSLEKTKKYVLYIGRIKATKGVKYLIDAMAKFQNKNIDLLLVGDGPDYYKYKRYVEERGLKNIKFLGAIYNEKKLLYLSACNCFVLPSFTEGAPVVLMEALARNLPIVATNVGGVNKMIRNGENGIIISLKNTDAIVNAIKKIIENPHRDLRKHAFKYRWRNIIKNTVNDYKALMH